MKTAFLTTQPPILTSQPPSSSAATYRPEAPPFNTTLDHAFLHWRELSMSRLAAFVKRLVTALLHCPPQDLSRSILNDV